MGEGGEDGSARMLSLSPTLAQTGRRKLLFEGFLLFFDLNVNLLRAVFNLFLKELVFCPSDITQIIFD